MPAKLLKFPRQKVHVFTQQELINLYKNAYSEKMFVNFPKNQTGDDFIDATFIADRLLKEFEPFDYKLWWTISVGFVAGVVLTAFLVSLL